jgi:large subunit ribosomal protein L9
MAKVIFLQNIKGVAQIGDVKLVTDGYARNFLMPRNLAKLAVPSAIKEAEILRKKRKEMITKDKEGAESVAVKLKEFTLEIVKNVNEDGTLYDSVSRSDISTQLKKNGFNVEPEDIKIKTPIKSVGEHEVSLNLGYSLNPELKINVKREEG